MSLGLVGRKVGMTRVFTDEGAAVPVTVLDVANNRVTQVKTPDADGYAAVQITWGKRRASRVVKPQAGHLAKAGVEAGQVLKEIRVGADELSKFKPGDVVGVDSFEVGQLVDVTGTTKGRGFSGVMRRHNFGGLRATHGVSVSHRSHGSTGGRQDPGKTWKNKKMAGHMGVDQVTTQNLRVVQTDPERGLILVEGSVPGHAGGWIAVRDAVKKPLPKEAPSPGKFRVHAAAQAGAPAAEPKGA